MLKMLREFSGHKVGDGRMDIVVESTHLLLGYGVNNLTLFKPLESCEGGKKRVIALQVPFIDPRNLHSKCFPYGEYLWN